MQSQRHPLELAPGASPSAIYFVKKLMPYRSLIQTLPFFFFAFESLLAVLTKYWYQDTDFMLKLGFGQLLAINCTLAGILHFHPPMRPFYLSMIFLPFKNFWLYSTGIALILGGIGVVFSRTQIISAWCLVTVFIVMFPGNIACVLMEHPRKQVFGGSHIAAILRLPFQFSFIAWAFWFTTPPLSL